MNERPILFSDAMVRQILAGNKTQTRRVMTSHTLARCPYGAPGDRLWVREAWAPLDADGCLPISTRTPFLVPEETEITYREAHDGETDWTTWRPSIHMPRWASRLTLEVTEVRVERLQAITEEDAIAEGVGPHGGWMAGERAVQRFRILWDSINGARPGCSWADDPWVWVVCFRPLEGA